MLTEDEWTSLWPATSPVPFYPILDFSASNDRRHTQIDNFATDFSRVITSRTIPL